MTHQENWKKKIMKLKREETERFAHEMTRVREIREEDKKRSDYDEQFSKDLLKSSGVDIGRIEDYEREQAERIVKEVEKERANLMGGRNFLTEFHGRRAVAYEVTSSSDTIVLPPYTGTLVATNEGLLEGVKGEKDNDNHSITPDNPEDINLRVTDTGSGTFAFGGYVYPAVRYDLWYGFTPPDTGTYQIRPSLDFHGFYIMKAYDKIWNSKQADINLDVEIDVNQYNWIGRQKYIILDEKKTNGTENNRLDETKTFSHYVELAGGDFSTVLLRISLAAGAKGNGSYAEADFGTGSANFIRPLVMTALHL